MPPILALRLLFFHLQNLAFRRNVNFDATSIFQGELCFVNGGAPGLLLLVQSDLFQRSLVLVMLDDSLHRRGALGQLYNLVFAQGRN